MGSTLAWRDEFQTLRLLIFKLVVTCKCNMQQVLLLVGKCNLLVFMGHILQSLSVGATLGQLHLKKNFFSLFRVTLCKFKA